MLIVVGSLVLQPADAQVWKDGDGFMRVGPPTGVWKDGDGFMRVGPPKGIWKDGNGFMHVGA